MELKLIPKGIQKEIKDCEEKLKEALKNKNEINKALEYKRMPFHAQLILENEGEDLETEIEEAEKHIKKLKEDLGDD